MTAATACGLAAAPCACSGRQQMPAYVSHAAPPSAMAVLRSSPLTQAAPVSLQPLQPRSSRQRYRAPVAALGASFMASPMAVSGLEGGFGLKDLSNLTAAAALGFAFLWYLRSQEGPQRDPSTPECPRCNGTGLEDCPICTRWSDGDKGCSACHGTLKVTCSACGGGGNAVPIKAKLFVKEDIARY